MTFTELQARIVQLSQLEGFTDITPAVVTGDFVNAAYLRLCWDAEANLVTDATLVTVIGQREYTVPGKWKGFSDITVNGVGVRRSTEDFEALVNPGWRVAANGQPSRWALADFSQFSLIPPPSAAGQAIRVTGQKQVTPLSAGSDVPILPDVYHDEIAMLGTFLLGVAYAQDEAQARLTAYLSRYQDKVEEIKGILNVERQQ